MILSATIRRMILIIGIVASVMAAAGAAYFIVTGNPMESLYFVFGVFLTASMNVLKIVLLERAVSKAVYMDESKSAGNYIRIQYFIRIVLTALVLILAAFAPFINLLGAVLGVFTMQITGYAQGMFIKKDEEAISAEKVESSGADEAMNEIN